MSGDLIGYLVVYEVTPGVWDAHTRPDGGHIHPDRDAADRAQDELVDNGWFDVRVMAVPTPSRESGRPSSASEENETMDGHSGIAEADEQYRDYAADAFEAVQGCGTPKELWKALWDVGLHVGRRPPDAIGKDWHVGLLEAIETSEDEESGWVVACRHSLSMALLEDVRQRERIAELEAVVSELSTSADALTGAEDVQEFVNEAALLAERLSIGPARPELARPGSRRAVDEQPSESPVGAGRGTP